MKKYRVAVIGTGYIGAVHIEQLMRLPNVVIAGIADKNAKLASEAAQRYSIEKIYKDAGEIIADRTIDGHHVAQARGEQPLDGSRPPLHGWFFGRCRIATSERAAPQNNAQGDRQPDSVHCTLLARPPGVRSEALPRSLL